jgi:hypothetical protein
MRAQLRSMAVPVSVIALLAGCSPATVATSKPRSTTAPPTFTAAPSPSATATAVAVPPGPYAVVVTNTSRQGSTYDILLVDLQGEVVTRVTARLPLLKPNQTVQLPLVSASNDLVYYRDGDTDIRALSAGGATSLAKTIPQGASSNMSFAVSPDDQRIAVALINEASDATKDTGRGYVENLADAGNHVDLFANTSLDALRWPAGWHGTDIIDAVGNQCGGPYGGANTSPACAASYHVIDSATGARRASICESPATQSPNGSQNATPNGLPVAGGVACVKTEYYYINNAPPEGDILAVQWSGQWTQIVSADKTGQLAYGGCFLAPGGAQMACAENTSQALTILAHGTAPHNLGRRYNVLGWMDPTHLLVDIDSKTLAVVSSATGAAVNVVLADADKVTMASSAPGGL